MYAKKQQQMFGIRLGKILSFGLHKYVHDGSSVQLVLKELKKKKTYLSKNIYFLF